jgi:hypothetical protein
VSLKFNKKYWTIEIIMLKKKMNRKFLCEIFVALMALCFCLGCASSNKSINAFEEDKLDETIVDAVTYLNGKLPKGSKILVLNIKSDYLQLSDYIIDGLVENIVNSGLFSVVDRQQLDVIRNELNFQTSGEVSDETAQSIGKIVGAQTIISGNIAVVGNFYRLGIRAIRVETAEVQGQFNRNIPDGPVISALTGKKISSTDRQNNNQTKISSEEVLPGLTGYYWGNLTGKIYESNLYSNQIQI